MRTAILLYLIVGEMFFVLCDMARHAGRKEMTAVETAGIALATLWAIVAWPTIFVPALWHAITHAGRS